MTFAAVPASRTSKPASAGNSTLSPGLSPSASAPTEITIPKLQSALRARGQNQPGPCLGLLVGGLDHDVVVERLQREPYRAGIRAGVIEHD